jgi:hypothetical protein
VNLVRKAVEKPKKRHKTLISQEQKEQRLQQKRQRSQLKNLRKPVRNVEE